MSIGPTEDNQELARVARSFLEAHGARAESRVLLEAPGDRLPAFWKEMAQLGWMGLHVEEARGGQGFGLPELSVVLEALGHAAAPGPFLPTALAETESIVLMNLRGVVRAVEGSEPGAEASVTKLLGSEVVQRKAALMTRLVGPAAALREGEHKRVATWLMATLGATIGGGTSEILRNQIAERLLDLPRDPLIQ